jgi:uncharacterized protein
LKHKDSIKQGSSDSLPALGVGIVYSSAIEPLIAEHPELFDVLEFEPQTTWIETPNGDAPFVVRDDVQQHISQLPGRKLVHSIGTPVGGSVAAHAAQLPLLRKTIETLKAPWASEHLSFNLTRDFFTGFFLPPRQTPEGVQTFALSVQRLAAELGVPVAIETGVNYLRPRPDELSDGAFMNVVAQTSDCGILLDLHNIYANQLNGRQTIEQFLAEIPLDRVWEVHLAGGFEMEGFWLDAHSGAVPEALMHIAREVIPSLSNIKAIVFEIFSSFIPRFGMDGIRAEMEKLHQLWSLRKPMNVRFIREQPAAQPLLEASDKISPSVWEDSLGSVVIGRPAVTTLEQELSEDPGTSLVNALIKEFRASMVVTVYRLTCRLMMLALGPDIFRAILEDFWSQTPPHQYASTEAEAFAGFLKAKNLRIPQLLKILEFERATVATLTDGQPRIVHFDLDPLPMLRALAEGHLIENPGEPGDYEIEVTADGPIRVVGIDPSLVSQTFPFH